MPGGAEAVAVVVVLAAVAYTVYALVRGPGSHRAASAGPAGPVAASVPAAAPPVVVTGALEPPGAAAPGTSPATVAATGPSPTVAPVPTTGTTSPEPSGRAPATPRRPAYPAPASSPAAVPAGLLVPGSAVSLRATTACCTSRSVRQQGDAVVTSVVAAASPAGDRGDASWIVRAGLAASSCVSFESANRPGRYLRHASFRLRSQPADGTALFRADATFCPTRGRSGAGTSFASYNYPTRYLRHYAHELYLAGDGGSNPWDARALWADDVSWRVAPAWAA